MQYVASKTFLHDQLGRVEKGTQFEATEAQLSAVRRFVEPYAPKVVREVPADESVAAPVETKRKVKGRK